jgi:RimK-like ATP-grasp domain
MHWDFMSFVRNIPHISKQKILKPKRNLSLSTYFPSGTQYFYGYPAGEASGFFNQVPPVIEELVAARAVSCAGEHVSVISFSATHAPQIDPAILQLFEIPQLDPRQHIVLPSELDRNLEGSSRNQRLKHSLSTHTQNRSLVMAQPFTDEEMVDYYQIPAKLTTWLNDKNSLSQLVKLGLLPQRLAAYNDGTALAAGIGKLQLPFVVKAASSSAGDGVFICQGPDDVKVAIDRLRGLRASILVESFVAGVHNYGIHFGVPHKRSEPIDIIGINEQLTTREGEFIGGVIWSDRDSRLQPILDYIRDQVLPYIRAMGWYGVGCFDVLEDRAGNFYFIDSNFRMTGMTAYHFLAANHTIQAPLLGFGGSFSGSKSELLAKLLPLASPGPERIVQLIALNRENDTWNFNGALLFNDHDQLQRRINRLLEAGVRSAALEQAASS